MNRRIVVTIIGVLMSLSLFGCNSPKHKLNLDGGLTSKKDEYPAGAKVKVTFPSEFIGTDTDYRFLSDDVDFKQDYSNSKGYIITFTMPKHDVTIRVTSSSSMTMADRYIIGNKVKESMVYDFYYTEENINYNAFYLRYRFYREDDRYYFFYDIRKKENDYGPATEQDRIVFGTIELEYYQWEKFIDTIASGKVEKRKQSNETGDRGPWTYLYWEGDKDINQQYSFGSYEKQQQFIELCEELMPSVEQQ